MNGATPMTDLSAVEKALDAWGAEMQLNALAPCATGDKRATETRAALMDAIRKALAPPDAIRAAVPVVRIRIKTTNGQGVLNFDGQEWWHKLPDGEHALYLAPPSGATK